MFRTSSKTLAALVGAAVLGGTAFQQAQATELKIATFMGPKHHLNAKVFPEYAETVAKATNGEVTLKLYSGGQLGKGPVQQFKRVVDNVAEISFGIQGYTSSIFPRTMVAAQPGIGKTAIDYAQALWKVYPEFLTSEYDKVKVLGLWANTPPILITRDKQVKEIGDVAGMKIRALDASNIPMMNAWGGSGIAIPISRVYDAIDKGVIDAIFVAANGVYAPWRFGEVAKYVTDGMNGPASLFWFAMNKQVWDGLSDANRDAIDKVSGYEFSIETARSWSQPDIKAIEKLKAGDPKTAYYTLTTQQAAAFNEATARSVEAFLEASEKKGIPARAIYKAAQSPSS